MTQEESSHEPIGEGTFIYVLPSEENMPPRAVLSPKKPVPGESVPGVLATWSQDFGAWTLDGNTPLPAELGDVITAHAKDLGVEW